ncbi:MAG TPA: DUF1559 domain-containing protein [Pirellulales bacterium]|nr:DUF1559 domain-containing protein [Pirellulales bacterium]
MSIAAIVSIIGIAVSVSGCGRKQKIEAPGPIIVDIVGPGRKLKEPKPIDVSYIPAEAVFAFVADSLQLTNAPNFQLVNRDLKDPLKLMGYDLDATDQIILIGGLGKKLGEYYVGSIQRFKQPVDMDAFLHIRSPEWEEVADGDHKYYRSQDKSVPCVCAIADRVILEANEETLKKMMSADKDADSPLLNTLRKMDDSSAATAVVEVAAIRPQISAFLVFTKLPAPFDAPPYDGIKKLPGNIDEAVLKFDIAPYTSLSATLRAKDEDAAIATDTFVANVVDKVVDTVEEMTAGSDDGGGDMRAGAQTEALRNLLGDIKELLVHSREGNELKVSYGGRPVQNQITMIGPTMISSYRNSWEKATVQASEEKLATIGAALNEYAAAKGTYPAPASYGPDGKPLLSWRVHLLPQLGQQALYDQFHLDEPWDSEHNKKLIKRMPVVYRNPGHLFDGKTQYVMPTGVGTVFEGKEGPKPDSLTDGKSKTILVVELFDGRGVEWTKPEDQKLDRADPTINLTHLAKPYFLAVFGDGVARRIDAKKNPTIVVGLFSPAGGEELPDEF